MLIGYVYITKYLKNIESEAHTAAVMESFILWNITPCSLVKANRRFGGSEQSFAWCLFYACLFLGLLVNPKNVGDMFIRNVEYFH
jgi:hypothetical protein